MDPSNQGSAPRHGSTVTFHNIQYTVPVKPPGKCCSPAVNKEILKDISGMFPEGRMSAIMGATGSGKTSLLDVLARRKDPSWLEGKILIDGATQPPNFKCKSGYVVQDDVVMGTLTIRENFLFSANLRLPKNISKAVKEERVDEIIKELGLEHVADSKVGNEFIRGVSGGERKRTNIGMELIIQPSVLFLDEPTTGLDANTANSVLKLLHRISRHGRTIIFSIHQPRFSIFKLFDQLMLLSKGRTVYHGPASEALDFFSSVGYECEPHNNPADFFLDVMNGETEPENGFNSIAESNGSEAVYNKNNHTENGDGDVKVNVVGASEDDEIADATMIKIAKKLEKSYYSSTWWNQIKGELDPILSKSKQTSSSNGNNKDDIVYATSFQTQFMVIAKRTVINLIRNPQTSIMQVVVLIVFGLLVGLIYRDVGNELTTGLQNRIGAFFFIVMNQIFGNLSAVELFISERALFVHENSNGFYRVSSFFLSKVFCDMIPMRTIPVLCFSAACYFLIGLDSSPDRFFIFVLVLILTSFSAASLGFFMGACFSVFAIANLGIALCYVFMMVFGGFLANVDSIDAWLQWLKYLSIFRYSLNALYINELKDLELCTTTTNQLTNVTSEICSTNFGREYLEDQNIPYETTWDLWQNMVALTALSVGFLVFAYIALRRINKYK